MSKTQTTQLQVWVDHASRWVTIDRDATEVGFASTSFANDLLHTWLLNRGDELSAGDYRVVIEADAGHPNVTSDEQQHSPTYSGLEKGTPA